MESVIIVSWRISDFTSSLIPLKLWKDRYCHKILLLMIILKSNGHFIHLPEKILFSAANTYDPGGL